ncbi:MAG: chemotaxis protein CheW [candidate division Zixibacteria bacterium]|nr:chemotaxis protein CheW [candidate division Zixibacteria bacterium]
MNAIGSDKNSDRQFRAGDELLQLVSFDLGSQQYGVDILQVQEINRTVDITKVPQAPEFVEGVINLRGQVVPVIDLRKRLHLEPKEHDKNTRIVVVDINGSVVGMVVDAVSEVLRLPSGRIEPPPEMVTGCDTEYIRGVAKLEERLLIILDISKILDVGEIARMAT